MRFKDILQERRASSVLFHFTTVNNATSILQSDEFRLSAGQTKYNPYMRKFPYYMSAARSPKSAIHTYTVIDNTTDKWVYPNAGFVLDGEWFNRNPNCVSSPIEVDNYDPQYQSKGPRYRHRVNAREVQRSMFEDRIWCKTNELPATTGMIKELHFVDKYYYKKEDEDVAPNIDEIEIVKLISVAKDAGIPWWLYGSTNDITTLNKTRAIESGK